MGRWHAWSGEGGGRKADADVRPHPFRGQAGARRPSGRSDLAEAPGRPARPEPSDCHADPDRQCLLASRVRPAGRPVRLADLALRAAGLLDDDLGRHRADVPLVRGRPVTRAEPHDGVSVTPKASVSHLPLRARGAIDRARDVVQQSVSNCSSSQSRTRPLRSERLPISQCPPAPSAALKRISVLGHSRALKKASASAARASFSAW